MKGLARLYRELNLTDDELRFINEGEEVLEPTFEVCSNDQWSIKTGEWAGNFAESDGYEGVRHFTIESFIMCSQKDGASDICVGSSDKIRCPGELISFFELDNKTHWIENRILPENIDWNEIEKAYEWRDFAGQFGQILKAIFDKKKYLGDRNV